MGSECSVLPGQPPLLFGPCQRTSTVDLAHYVVVVYLGASPPVTSAFHVESSIVWACVGVTYTIFPTVASAMRYAPSPSFWDMNHPGKWSGGDPR